MNNVIQNDLYSFMHRCQQVTSFTDFQEVIKHDLREILPHEYAALGLGVLNGYRVQQYFHIDYPHGYLEQVVSSDKVLQSPVVAKWSQSLRPQLASAQDFKDEVSPLWIAAFHDYQLENIGAHGLVDMMGNHTSYFCFSRIPLNEIECAREMIGIVTPHLHEVVTRLIKQGKQSPEIPHCLSDREIEVLKWIYAGKTNSEISDILKISRFTVKNHLHKILEKLGVRNRTHAMAKAMSMGVIDI